MSLRPLGPLLLVVLGVTLPFGPSAALDPPPLPGAPQIGDTTFTFTFEQNGTQVSVVLDNQTTLLGYNPPTPQQVVVLVPKTLYVKFCYPCEEITAPAYSPLYKDHCFIGTEPRHEQRVCLFDREGGITLEVGEVDELAQAVMVWGDGCVIHQREDLPPQKFGVEGIALPAVSVTPGGSC